MALSGLILGFVTGLPCQTGKSLNFRILLSLQVLLQTRVFDENGGSGTSVALHTNK